jgi:soluble lytic murein transglycosylase-like protein
LGLLIDRPCPPALAQGPVERLPRAELKPATAPAIQVWPEGLFPVTWACLKETAELFGLPPSLILLILEVESGRVGQISKNKNGSFDMGPMQINSFWLPRLQALGLNQRTVIDHGCVNLAVGSWILRSHLSQTKNIAQAISDYHSLDPGLGRKYLRVARSRLKNLDPERILKRANGQVEDGRGAGF